MPVSDGHRQASIRIKRVPENHWELRDFCQRVQDELKMKLYYKGESPGVLGDRFVREFLVKKRECIPKAEKDALMEKQKRRCFKCNDLLGGRWKVHHDSPVAEGGSSQEICLVCPTCHAEETEKQELKA